MHFQIVRKNRKNILCHMKIIYETQVSESFIVQNVLLAQSHDLFICYLWLTWGCSGRGIVTGTTWLAKLKIFTNWPFTEKVC